MSTMTQGGYQDPSMTGAGPASYNPNAYTNLSASGTSSNPFAQPQMPMNGVAAGPGPGFEMDQSAGSSRLPPAGTQLLDHDLLQQGSVYLPGAAQELQRSGKIKPGPGKRETVIRKGNGKTWEDPTLLDWDPSEWLVVIGTGFRLHTLRSPLQWVEVLL